MFLLCDPNMSIFQIYTSIFFAEIQLIFEYYFKKGREIYFTIPDFFKNMHVFFCVYVRLVRVSFV